MTTPILSTLNPDLTVQTLQLALQQYISRRALDFWETPGVVARNDDGTLTITYADNDPMRNIQSLYHMLELFPSQTHHPDLSTMARTFDPSKSADLGGGMILTGDPATFHAVLQIIPQEPLPAIFERIRNEEEKYKSPAEHKATDQRAQLNTRPDLTLFFTYLHKKFDLMFGDKAAHFIYYDQLQPPKAAINFNRPADMTVEQVKAACAEFGRVFGEANVNFQGAFASTDKKIALEITGSERMLAASICRNDQAFAPITQAQLN